MYKKSYKNIIRLFIMVTSCLVGLMAYPASAQEQGYKALLLNSYHDEFTWTKEQTKGILNKLKDPALDTTLYIEYMDWKNFPHYENLDNLYSLYKEKYENTKFDVVITTDDIALEFALEYREELFSNAPIVFSGVNEAGELKHVKGIKNITGIIEPINLEETIAMALQINPNMKELYIIYDQTESGRSTYAIVENIIRSSYQGVTPISITKKSYKEIMEEVQGLGEDSAILITSHYKDPKGKTMEFEDLSKLTSSASKVPVFNIYDMTLGYGNIGGSMISASIQGENAGELAARIIKGEKADEIEIIRGKGMRVAFDYEQLQRFNIPMNLIPQGVEIINEPFSFFKTYKHLVLTVLIIIALLVAFVIILMIYINEIQRIKYKLQESNEEITQTYEELTASDEELQQQVEELNSIQNQLREMAYYDSLTQLPNKRALHEDFHSYIINCKNKKGAVIFIDADNFKLINDTLGHSLGDKLIIQIGKRLQKLVSKSVKVYRMGGDEFLLLITNIIDGEDVKEIVDKIMAGFDEGFSIEDMMIHTTVSAGITVYPDHGETAETLIMRADIAMYKAKEEGKAKYVFYDTKMNQDLLERAAIEVNLRTAIENQELSLNYQPQYDLRTKEIIGFEALLRWKNKELGWVSPLKFIGIAEDSHTIIPIGKWVLNTACKFIKSIHELGHKNYTIAVNISLLQMMQEDFVDMVLQILQENNLEPKYLEIEMTETMLIENFKMVVTKLGMLRGHGVRVALDDFGTGYSSLNYLNLLPINTLKIDKSFVDTISLYGEQKVIISILITLGHKMGLKVIAEGVETEEEFEYLCKHDCDSMQGYLLSRPLPENEVMELLAGK